MNPKFNFIFAPRFWHLFGAGMGTGMATYETTGNWVLAVGAALTVWFGGAAGVGTIDRISDKNLEAAKASKK